MILFILLASTLSSSSLISAFLGTASIFLSSNDVTSVRFAVASRNGIPEVLKSGEKRRSVSRRVEKESRWKSASRRGARVSVSRHEGFSWLIIVGKESKGGNGLGVGRVANEKRKGKKSEKKGAEKSRESRADVSISFDPPFDRKTCCGESYDSAPPPTHTYTRTQSVSFVHTCVLCPKSNEIDFFNDFFPSSSSVTYGGSSQNLFYINSKLINNLN